MTNPKVSIIIPVYNTEKYLRECLDSVINQTLTDIEIICVNDGSTDGSGAILQEYAKKNPRIQLIEKQNNEGLLLARKSAVTQATAQYICFLDSDDRLSQPNSIQTMVNFIEQEKTDILQFNVEITGEVPDDIKNQQIKWLKVYPEKIENSYNIIRSCIDNQYSWNLWNKIYQTTLVKKAYQHIKNIHLITAEDAYAYFLIAYHAHTFKGIKTSPLYQYRLGHGATTTIGTTLPAFKNYAKEITIVSYLETFLKTEHQLQPYQEILNKLRQRIQHHTLEKFEELSHNDALAGFQTFKTFYGPEVLLNQYSRWKEKKYVFLAMIGFSNYQRKANFYKKLSEILNIKYDR